MAMSYNTLPTVLPGLGTTLSYDTSAPPHSTPVWVLVGQRTSIDGPDVTVGEADTTNLDSTWKTSRPTLPDGGTLSLTIEYNPADTSHLYLTGLVGTPAIIPWKLQYADGMTTPANDTFLGFLTGFKPNGMEAESNLLADVTIRVVGNINFNPGS